MLSMLLLFTSFFTSFWSSVLLMTIRRYLAGDTSPIPVVVIVINGRWDNLQIMSTTGT